MREYSYLHEPFPIDKRLTLVFVSRGVNHGTFLHIAHEEVCHPHSFPITFPTSWMLIVSYNRA